MKYRILHSKRCFECYEIQVLVNDTWYYLNKKSVSFKKRRICFYFKLSLNPIDIHSNIKSCEEMAQDYSNYFNTETIKTFEI